MLRFRPASVRRPPVTIERPFAKLDDGHLPVTARASSAGPHRYGPVRALDFVRLALGLRRRGETTAAPDR